MRFAANLSLMFTEWALPDRFAAAREAGFEGVEIQFPYDHSAETLAAARERAGVEVVLINAPVAPPDHPIGLAADPAAGAAFAGSLDQAADYAAALGARRIHVLAGRGEAGPLLVERFAQAQARLAPAELLLEALNPIDQPGYAVPTIAIAADIAAACPAPIGLQFDLYHCAMVGGDPLAVVDRLLSRIAHVQFAACPGRHEPDRDDMSILATLDALAAAGYAGWVAAEYRPRGATLDSLGWLTPWQARYR